MSAIPTTPNEQREAIWPHADGIFKVVIQNTTSKPWCDWLRPPLEHAAASSDLSLVTKLLEARANRKHCARGCRGRTLLYAAADGGDAKIATALLRAGAHADINFRSGPKRRSALHRAASLGHDAVSRVLMLGGAEVGLLDAEKRMPLHLAVKGGHQQVVNDLLLGGACPNARDKNRDTPVHLAASGGHDRILGVLLLNGADRNALDTSGRSALHVAAENGHASVAETLLNTGADVNNIRYGESEISVLDSAASHGSVNVLKALLLRPHGIVDDSIPDVNAIDSTGYTALHMAADNNQVEATDILVQAGANVEAQDQHHWTPLHCAARYNGCFEAMFALLTSHQADVNARDTAGESPLHIACAYLAPAAADLLLKFGADESAVKSDGRTASEAVGIYADEFSSGLRLNVDETIEHVRRLVDRSPQDRAWRRRGTMVLCRYSHYENTRSMAHDHRGCSAIFSVCHDTSEFKQAESNGGSGIEHHQATFTKAKGGERRPRLRDNGKSKIAGIIASVAGDHCSVYVEDRGCEASCISEMVSGVVQLREEDVFRTIVGYL